MAMPLAAGNADEVARAEEGHGEAQGQLRRRRLAESDPVAEFGRQDVEAVGAEAEQAGQGRAGHDILHARFLLARIFVSCFGLADVAADLQDSADLQDFSSSPAFRIGQVAVDDHRPPQRNGKQYA